MKSQKFLYRGGILLVILGLLGYIGILGPLPTYSLFGDKWWFDSSENVAHFVLGVVSITAVYVFDTKLQKYLALFIGGFALLAVVKNIPGETVFLGANLEIPGDILLNIVFAVWAFWATLWPPRIQKVK